MSWSHDYWFDLAEAEQAAKGITGFSVTIPQKRTGCPHCGAPSKVRKDTTNGFQHCRRCIAHGVPDAAKRRLP